MFTEKDIEKLSELVKLPVSDEEKTKLSGMLSQTTEYMDMLNELDTSKVEPTYQVTGLVNVFQMEDLYQTLTPEEVLQNAKKTKEGMIGTSAVLERE
jgi:aspartyl-tRNA(Asn)/glutamyl-tRNA(Gln) amidotransferase subunit C